MWDWGSGVLGTPRDVDWDLGVEGSRTDFIKPILLDDIRYSVFPVIVLRG